MPVRQENQSKLQKTIEFHAQAMQKPKKTMPTKKTIESSIKKQREASTKPHKSMEGAQEIKEKQ